MNRTSFMSFRPLWQARWRALSGREQTLLLSALALVLGALLWWLALAPALKVLRTVDSQRAALDAQWQQMQSLQAQASSLQAQARLAPEEERRLLEASLKPLGAGSVLKVDGERATISLRAVPAQALALWLTQVRQNVRRTPVEAHLVRNAAGSWDGTVVLALAPGVR